MRSLFDEIEENTGGNYNDINYNFLHLAVFCKFAAKLLNIEFFAKEFSLKLW